MNLGIYNEAIYNEGPVYLNKHIDQGIQFKEFERKASRDNQYNFLEDTSSPNLGSIVEALTGMDSTQQTAATTSTSQLTAGQIELNKLISEYSTLYKTYVSTMINKGATDLARVKIEKELSDKQIALVAASNKLNGALTDANAGAGAGANAADAAALAKASNLASIAATTKKVAAFDYNTLGGKIETSDLSMTSMYFHYLVYFLISLTLIAFTFNILVNPKANTMSAIIVVAGLIVIYIIARHYTIPL